MNKGDELKDLRGMSDPFFFAFNILDERQDKVQNMLSPGSPEPTSMLCHGVIFTSYIIPGEGTMKLCDLDDDPRMRAFVKYVWSNFLKEKKHEFKKALEAAEKELAATTKREGSK